ncbi:uncharacterized protein LOC112847737 [Oreochromis niloticus]|uniref:uncharacterized protein LOC112847737 n=1 Tax=Oreochromis niloticus TaxID=8128 RepID=UPI000DF3B2ED|nr:uncharacterized protein LOC112847737 [Oreochromis niloticus]CAI5689569.1 unnamed protein product [Mustela putorius furo]
MNTKRRSIGTLKHKHREGHTGQRHKGNLNDKEITHCKQGRPNCHGPGKCWAFPQGRHFHPWAEPPHHADRLHLSVIGIAGFLRPALRLTPRQIVCKPLSVRASTVSSVCSSFMCFLTFVLSPLSEDLRTLSSRCRNLLGFQRWSVHSFSMPTCLPPCPVLRIIISPHPDHLPSKLCLRLRMMIKPLPLPPPSSGVRALTDFPVSGSPFHPRQPHGHF